MKKLLVILVLTATALTAMAQTSNSGTVFYNGALYPTGLPKGFQSTTTTPEVSPFMSASPTNVVVGNPILVQWKTAHTITVADSLVMLKVGSTSSEIVGQKSVLLRNGDTIFTPTSPGTYEFRYFRWNGQLALVSNQVTIRDSNPPPPPVSASPGDAVAPISPTRIRIIPDGRHWISIGINAKAGKKYRIVASGTLQKPVADWEPVMHIVPSGVGEMAVSVPLEPNTRFFRVREE